MFMGSGIQIFRGSRDKPSDEEFLALGLSRLMRGCSFEELPQKPRKPITHICAKLVQSFPCRFSCGGGFAPVFQGFVSLYAGKKP